MKYLIFLIPFLLNAQTRIIPFSTNPTPGVSIPDSLETAGTVLWLESDYGVTKTASGDSVYLWEDRSAGNHDMPQDTAGMKPIWSSDGILFDGDNDYMRVAWTQAYPYTIYLVVNQVGWTVNDKILSGAGTASPFSLKQITSTPTYRVENGAGNADTTSLCHTGAYHLVTIVVNGDSPNSIHQINNETIGYGDPSGLGTNLLGGITLASSNRGTIAWGNIKFKAVIVRKYADNEATINSIKSYLNNKYTIY